MADMRVELTHQYGNGHDQYWQLDVVGERGGMTQTYFSEDLKSLAGREREDAAARLAKAGYTVSSWRTFEYGVGWHGELGATV